MNHEQDLIALEKFVKAKIIDMTYQGGFGIKGERIACRSLNWTCLGLGLQSLWRQLYFLSQVAEYYESELWNRTII